jgi:hypothetical protein
MARVARVDLPQRSVLKPLYAKAGFADAFAIDLPSNATGDAERLAAHIVVSRPFLSPSVCFFRPHHSLTSKRHHHLVAGLVFAYRDLSGLHQQPAGAPHRRACFIDKQNADWNCEVV